MKTSVLILCLCVFGAEALAGDVPDPDVSFVPVPDGDRDLRLVAGDAGVDVGSGGCRDRRLVAVAVNPHHDELGLPRCACGVDEGAVVRDVKGSEGGGLVDVDRFDDPHR